MENNEYLHLSQRKHVKHKNFSADAEAVFVRVLLGHSFRSYVFLAHSFQS